MSLSGSARDEMTARVSVSGMYLKRVITIIWTLVGLIAVALFGVGGLSDPDLVWGEMSSRLLGPGLIGLMLVGIFAGTMATASIKILSVASLIACNIFRPLRPQATAREELFYSRLAVIVVLALGVLVASMLGDFLSLANLALTINLPFGAAVFLIFFWRRLTAAAVWCSMSLSIIVILVVPWTVPQLPALRSHPALVQTGASPDGKIAPVYFSALTREESADTLSPPSGRGRFNFECWLLDRAGFNTATLTPLERFTVQFIFDALFPFVIMFIVSAFTRPSDQTRVDFFYGKMKTPIGLTPELEKLALEATHRDPRRFDHTKLLPGSAWEFCRWDRVDTLGFLACCAVSGLLVAAFAGLLAALA